ncbi:MAG: hypothetical protein COT73_05920 [Bdellovibrio sp. CG10_big_fil_rev_8_21_14_0_10_47_8]|nr:MAG: hypothetical protein COT73_05920 [Bdellovibrio sp. CG10_big_fil_rev_8_21_14_0_10_47_8]
MMMRDQRGMSLITVLMVTAMVATVSMIVGQIFINLRKEQAAMEQKARFLQITEMLQRMVGDSATCTKLMCSGASSTCTNSTGPLTLNLPTEAGTISEVTEGSQYELLTIQQLRIQPAATIAPNVDITYFYDDGGITPKELNVPTSLKQGKLVFAVNRTAQVLGVREMAPLELDVVYWETPGNKVISCVAPSVIANCTAASGVAPINAGTGNVNYVGFDPGQVKNSQCNIAEQFGGCKYGGTYSMLNGSCNIGNTYVGSGACACPTGYDSKLLVDYQPAKSSRLTVYQCLTCNAASAGVTSGNSEPIFNEGAVDEFLSSYSSGWSGVNFSSFP